jgi:hypothetical protein
MCTVISRSLLNAGLSVNNIFHRSDEAPNITSGNEQTTEKSKIAVTFMDFHQIANTCQAVNYRVVITDFINS